MKIIDVEGFPYRIRPMEGGDVPAIMVLDQEAFTDPWPESAYTYELYFNPSAHYLVLEQIDLSSTVTRWRWPWQSASGTSILGFIGVRIQGDEAHISVLAVRGGWRGRGLGELLILTGLDLAIEYGANEMTLEVRVSNVVAQNLYSKYDFKVISRLTGYYQDGEDAYLMRVWPLDEPYHQILQVRRQMLLAKMQAILKDSGRV